MRGLRAPKGPPWSLLSLAWAVVVVLALVGVQTTLAQRRSHRLRRCDRPPGFAVNGVEPMSLTEGRVTVVALLIHTCSFCQRQAASLNELHHQYRSNGSDVEMFIVNGGLLQEPGSYNVDFPVYQDDASEQLWRRVFGGSKDDIFIFDRCGMLTYKLGMPYSYLGFNYVQRAIHNTLTTPICPRCHRHGPDPHDAMVADAPFTSVGMRRGRRGHGRGHRRGRLHADQQDSANGDYNRLLRRHRNRSQCPREDELCRELRRQRRKFNRLRHQQGLGHLSEEQAVRLLGTLLPDASPPL